MDGQWRTSAILVFICNTEIMVNIAKDPAVGLNGAVAAELRAERAAKGITFDALTERVSLSKSTLLLLFNARRLISLEALVEITSALGISVIEIVERAENRLEREPSEPKPEPQQ
jgi:DNA-binding helix-turn-helix protein